MPSSTLSTSSHLQAFSVAVSQWCRRHHHDEARSASANQAEKAAAVEEMEQIVQILNKSSDLVGLADASFILDAHWLLRQLLHPAPESSGSGAGAGSGSGEPAFYRAPLLWHVLTLLTRLADRSPRWRRLLRDRLRLAQTLTPLLLALPATSHERTLKVLQLLRLVCYGVKIDRLEGFVVQLVPKLMEWVDSAKDPQLASLSLFLLCALCRENYVVATYVKSTMTEKERKTLFAEEKVDERRMEVLFKYLAYWLSRSNLSSGSCDTSDVIVVRLATLSDAFSAAYGDDDFLQLELFNDFLRRVRQASSASSASRKLLGEEALDDDSLISFVQQILLVADYGEASHPSCNEALFGFLRLLSGLHDDPTSLLDVIVKALQLRLDAVRSASASAEAPAAANALLLLKETVGLVLRQRQLDSAQLENVKLQLEPLAATLGKLLWWQLDQLKAGKRQQPDMATLHATAETLREFAGEPSWAEMVRPKVATPKKMVSRVESLAETTDTPTCLGPVLADLLLLCQALARGESSATSEWSRAHSVLVSKAQVTQCLTRCLRGRCRHEGGNNANVLLALGVGADAAGVAAEEQEALADTQQQDQETRLVEAARQMTLDERQAVDQMLDTVGRAVEREETHKNLSEILDLGDLRLCSQQRQLDTLKASLKMADERIVMQNDQNEKLELELSKMQQLFRSVLMRAQASEQEVADVRIQYDALQEETTDYRNKTKKESDERMESLARENAKVTSKAAKYKEQTEVLQDTILEHIKVQAELTAKLKSEAKANAELTTAVEKRDDKLRKKEKQLDDESSRRERLEHELESQKKEIASLQTLRLRQEQALAKKEKELQEQMDELADFKRIQEQIFNLSKGRPTS